MAVLVVDFAGFRGGERVVGFGDLDELLGGGLVTAARELVRNRSTWGISEGKGLDCRGRGAQRWYSSRPL